MKPCAMMKNNNDKHNRTTHHIVCLPSVLLGIVTICFSCQNSQNVTNAIELDSISYQDTIIYSPMEYGIVDYHCVYSKHTATATHDSIMSWICQQFGDETGLYRNDIKALLTKRAEDFAGEGKSSLTTANLTDDADYYLEAINLSVTDEDSLSITLCCESFTTQRGLHIYPNYNSATFSKQDGHRMPLAVHHLRD